MFAIQTIRTTIVLLTIVLLLDKCSGYPSIREKQGIAFYCTGCGDFCHKCEYGTVISNACGIRQCAKGPDESCGGPRELYGICGEGMRCNCNKCVGCSLEKLNCSVDQDPCLPHKSSESRDMNRFERWSTAM
ncbi:PREDICTED: neuroparsin-A-like [Eufriesea mexicana]|uniref:neuroparsin-A-like n=1 Tax=Eufriesea mexicana TaxID=516756 RepID=UPI00083C0039|nr:PREDICTED: neuroparsin-A-like [Eufriesea mexicana]